jgi:hypothetical protein
MLVEVPAAAEMAAAKPAKVAAAEAAEMTTAEAAYVTAAEAAHVAEVSAGEMSPATVEAEAVVKSVVEMVPSDEDRTTKPVAIVVIRIGVAVTIVVAGAIIRPIVVVAVRIAGGDAADHSGRDGRAGIVAIAVNVAVSVSPNVVVMAHVVTRDIPKACVAMCDIPVQAV